MEKFPISFTYKIDLEIEANSEEEAREIFNSIKYTIEFAIVDAIKDKENRQFN